MEKKSNKIQVESETYIFEVNGFKFRRHGHLGEKHAQWSLYSMTKSISQPNLLILVKVNLGEITVQYYYHCDIPDAVAHAAQVFYEVYLKIIYPWVHGIE